MDELGQLRLEIQTTNNEAGATRSTRHIVAQAMKWVWRAR